jgi:hypothetical protein
VTATPTNRSGQIRVAWSTPLSNGGAAITDYVIQRSPNGTSSWTTIGDGVNTATAYTVTGLVDGSRYYFRVVARNAAGYSPSSNVASAIPRTVPTAPRSPAAAPTNVSGQIRVTWVVPSSNGGAPITDYVIQRSLNGSTNWVSLSDGVSTATAYTVTGLVDGSRYYFRVFARNAAGYSPASTVVSATPRTVPGTVAYFVVDASFEGFDLSWGDPPSTGGSPITGFVIQAFDVTAGSWFTVGVVSASWSAAFVPAPGEGCGTFRIAARNAAGIGPYRGPVTDCWP